MSICVWILVAWNFNSFDNFMVSQLFKIKKPKNEIDMEMDYLTRFEFIKRG